MSPSAPPAVLVTIPISHYCERARWALDRAQVRYRERAHLQLVHRIAVRRAGGGSTVPVLVTGDGVLSDSAEIVDYADARARPGRGLYPSDPDLAAETRALESDFSTRLGPHGRRWMYDGLRGRRDLAMAYAGTGAPAWQRRALPLAYPAIAYLIDRRFDITPATAAESELEVRAVLDAVSARLGDGRPYLMGDCFTAADLTFAALAAPVLMPSRYSVPLPQLDELPAAMAATVRELRAHPAGAHALAMFRHERR